MDWGLSAYLKGVGNVHRAKTFLAGILFGCFLLTGAAFASEQLNIAFYEASVSLDGITISEDLKRADGQEQDNPSVVELNGDVYWSMDHAADSLGLEWTWDRDSGEMELTTRRAVIFQELQPSEWSPDMQVWVEQSQTKELAQTQVIDGSTYILITRGAKNTGGYEVAVASIEQAGEKLTVHVDYTNPKKGDIVTQGVTYPSQLIRVTGEYKVVQFRLGDGTELPELRDINVIPGILKESQGIMVFSSNLRGGVIIVEGAVQSFAGAAWMELVSGGDSVWKDRVSSSIEAPDWSYFSLEVPSAMVTKNSVLTISAMSPEGDATQQVELGYELLTARSYNN
jgi:hypothetical protein